MTSFMDTISTEELKGSFTRPTPSGQSWCGLHFPAHCGVPGLDSTIVIDPKNPAGCVSSIKEFIRLAIEAAYEQIAGEITWHSSIPGILNRSCPKCLRSMTGDVRYVQLWPQMVSNCGPFKEPTKVIYTDPGYVIALDRPCTGDHEHTH